MTTTQTMKIPDSIKTRMAVRVAEILGEPQRLSPLGDDELDEEAREWVTANSAAFGVTHDGPPKISNTFRTFFRNFPLFRAQMGVYTQLLVKNTLSNRDREITIMRMLWLCNSPNPYGEHVKIGRQIGMTHAELVGVLEGPESSVWTNDHEHTVLVAIDEIYQRQAMSDEIWSKLMAVWSDKQMIEFISCATQYYSSACLHNVLRTRPADNNKAYGELEE